MEENIKRYMVTVDNNTGSFALFHTYLNNKNIEHKYLSYFNTFVFDVSLSEIEEIKGLEFIAKIVEDIKIEDVLSIAYLPSSKKPKVNSKQFNLNYGVEQIKVNELWKKCINGKGVNVAILDNGVVPHKALKIKKQVSFVPLEEAGDGFDSSLDMAHGTHIAGIIGARDYENGLMGVAYGCNLYNVKVIDNIGNGYWSYLLQGFNWCILNNINIINLGFSLYDLVSLENKKGIDEIINTLNNNNIILVSPAGNNVVYPLRLNNIISVGAVDKNDKIARFSNFGEKVDYVAPGVAIESTGPDNDKVVLSGTSMAAAHVTGLIALLLSDDIRRGRKLKSSVEIQSILNLNVVNTSIPANRIIFGNGRIEAPLYKQ